MAHFGQAFTTLKKCKTQRKLDLPNFSPVDVSFILQFQEAV